MESLNNPFAWRVSGGTQAHAFGGSEAGKLEMPRGLRQSFPDLATWSTNRPQVVFTQGTISVQASLPAQNQ